MILYLSVEQIIQIHDRVIAQNGDLPGLRSKNELESAVEAPKVSLYGNEMYKTIAEKCSVYLYHIIKNHPFTVSMHQKKMSVSNFVQRCGFN
jgi:death on curing protein